MVEAVGCVASIAASCPSTDVLLGDVVSATDIGEAQRVLFQSVAERAITTAVAEPHNGVPIGLSHDDLTASFGNLVADRKHELFSTVIRPGAETTGKSSAIADAPEPPEDDRMAQVSERIKSLYMELTEYQVAWKVGHKVQQDISQILRGQ